MANIIWSFGIALQAQDEASEPINNVISSIGEMDRSLAQLNQRQIENIAVVHDLSQEYLNLQGAMVGVAGGFNGGAEAASMLSGAVGDVGNAVALAEAEATGGLSLLLTVIERVAEYVTIGVIKVVSGIAYIVDTALSLAYKGLVKLGEYAVSGISYFIKKSLEVTWTAAKASVSGFGLLFSLPTNIVKGFASLLSSIPDILENWLYIPSIRPLVDKFNEVSDSIKRVIGLAEEFYPLEHRLNTLAIQLGGVRSNTKGLEDQVIRLTLATGASLDQSTELAESLGRVGIAMDKFGGFEGASNDQLQRLGLLVSRFGLAADEAVRLERSSILLGSNLSNLTDHVVLLQTKFKLPGMLNVLPDVVDHVIRSFGRFGRYVIGDEKRVIDQTLKMASTISKTMGKDIREATRLAQEGFDTFSEAISQDQDVYLGLSDRFSELTMSLLESGIDYNRAQQLMITGQQDRLKFATEFAEANARVALMDPRVAERNIRLVAKHLDATTALWVRNANIRREAWKHRQKEEETAAIGGIASFDKMSKALSETTTASLDILQNLSKGFKSIFGFIFSDAIRPFIEETNAWIGITGNLVMEFIKGLDKNSSVIALKTTFNQLADALFGAETSTFGLLFSFRTFMASILNMGTINTIIDDTNKALTSVLETIKVIQKEGFANYLLGSFSSAFSDITDLLSDLSGDIYKLFTEPESKGLGNSFKGFMFRVFYDVTKAFNKLLGGLPQTLLKRFFPDYKKSIEEGMGSVGFSIGGTTVSILSKVGDTIRDKLKDWVKYVDENWGLIKTSISTKTFMIGNTLGAFTAKVGKFISDLFSGEGLSKSWDAFTKDFDDKVSTDGSVLNSISKLANKLKDAGAVALKSFTDGFLAPFGTNFSAVYSKISFTLRSSMNGAKQGLQELEAVFYDVYDIAFPLFKGLGDVLITVLNGAIIPLVKTMNGFVTLLDQASSYTRIFYALKEGKPLEAAKAVLEVGKAPEREKERDSTLTNLSLSLGGLQEKLRGFTLLDTEARRKSLGSRTRETGRETKALAAEGKMLGTAEGLGLGLPSGFTSAEDAAAAMAIIVNAQTENSKILGLIREGLHTPSRLLHPMAKEFLDRAKTQAMAKGTGLSNLFIAYKKAYDSAPVDASSASKPGAPSLIASDLQSSTKDAKETALAGEVFKEAVANFTQAIKSGMRLDVHYDFHAQKLVTALANNAKQAKRGE